MYVYFILFLDKVPIAQACLELNYAAEDNQTSDLPSDGITGVCYHGQFMQCWASNPGLCEC